MSKLFSTRIRVYVVFMSKSPPFRTRFLRKDYQRRTTGHKLNGNLVPEKLSLKLEWSIRRSQPRSKGRRETLGTNGKEVSWSLRWLNTVGSLWVYVICQIMARERLQLTSWNLASEKCTDERFWLTGKSWRFRSFHGNMNDWIQPYNFTFSQFT